MSKRVLIVDDVPDWCAMLEGLVRDFFPDAQVITTMSQEEAKRHLASNSVDVAIIDVRLDESDETNEDGLILMELIWASYGEVPVFIITGYSNLETVKKAMHPDASGSRLAVDYIEKNRIHQLIERLEPLLTQTD